MREWDVERGSTGGEAAGVGGAWVRAWGGRRGHEALGQRRSAARPGGRLRGRGWRRMNHRLWCT